MSAERRKYVRFLAQDTAFAALRNGFKKVGRIKDISIGGLAFSYLSEMCQISSDSHVSQVDIFNSGNGLHLYSVPCSIVYDTPDLSNAEGFSVTMCRCGLHFNDLTEYQLDQLNFFIKKYSIGILKTGKGMNV